MLRIFQLATLLGLVLSFNTSCCRSGCNPWTEKDCYYSDYYQSPPPAYARVPVAE